MAVHDRSIAFAPQCAPAIAPAMLAIESLSPDEFAPRMTASEKSSAQSAHQIPAVAASAPTQPAPSSAQTSSTSRPAPVQDGQASAAPRSRRACAQREARRQGLASGHRPPSRVARPDRVRTRRGARPTRDPGHRREPRTRPSSRWQSGAGVSGHRRRLGAIVDLGRHPAMTSRPEGLFATTACASTQSRAITREARPCG